MYKNYSEIFLSKWEQLVDYKTIFWLRNISFQIHDDPSYFEAIKSS